MIEKLSWDQVKQDVSVTNPDLYKIVEQLPLEAKHSLYIVEFNYGQELIDSGIFMVPEEYGLTQLNRTDLANELGYNDMNHPVFLVLSGCVETSLRVGERSVPFGISKSGGLVGLWKALDNKTGFSHCLNLSNWRVTSGARTAFMLPKISDARGHHRLEVSYGRSIRKPRSQGEHYRTFADIAGDRWKSRLLLFSEAWFLEYENEKWEKFYSYLLDLSWKSSGYWRNSFTWDVAFNQIDSGMGIQANRHVFDIAKHLIITAMGSFPAFRPLSNNDLAPISDIQDAYTEVYRIKYAPIVFAPAHYNFRSDAQPVYFSLQYNTALELAARSTLKSTNMEEMYQVYLLLHKYLRALTGDEYLKTPIVDLLNTQFDFFHKSDSDYRGFRGVQELFREDRALKNICDDYKDLEIPYSSSFFSGCIRIKGS